MTTELDPEMVAALETIAGRGYPFIHEASVSEAREMIRDIFGAEADAVDSVGVVEDGTVPGPAGDVPVRVYTPDGEGPFPILVFCHGGGFVAGDLEAYDPTCRTLVHEGEFVVVSVDYRRAPEAQFPEPLADCYAAAAYVADNPGEFGGDGRVAIGGDSAGGNMATAVSLLARERDGPTFTRQVLVYPATDYGSDSGDEVTGSFLNSADMAWFWDLYLPDDIHGLNPCVSPLQTRDLSGLPSATILTAEVDPLRDDGIAYAERLEAAGVSVTHRHYDGLTHGFLSMLADPELPQAREAIRAVCADLWDSF